MADEVLKEIRVFGMKYWTNVVMGISAWHDPLREVEYSTGGRWTDEEVSVYGLY